MAVQLTVVGSVNLDLVASVERLPRTGETLTASSFASATYPSRDIDMIATTFVMVRAPFGQGRGNVIAVADT